MRAAVADRAAARPAATSRRSSSRVRGCGAFPPIGSAAGVVDWHGRGHGRDGRGLCGAGRGGSRRSDYLPEARAYSPHLTHRAGEGTGPRGPGGPPGACRRSGGLRAHRRRRADPVPQPPVAARRRLRAAAASTIGLMWPILLGYLAGSVPFAFLLARRAGIDVRVAGSGNVGAANVLRTTGTWRGVARHGARRRQGRAGGRAGVGDARRRHA